LTNKENIKNDIKIATKNNKVPSTANVVISNGFKNVGGGKLFL